MNIGEKYMRKKSRHDKIRDDRSRNDQNYIYINIYIVYTYNCQRKKLIL